MPLIASSEALCVSCVVFPGQGSQRIKMALDFAESFPESREVFETAQRALPFDVREICSIEDGRLDLTEYTQPCILTAEIAMYRALQSHAGLSPEYFGGHSLGEYTALVAANAIPLPVALELVHLRGQLMQAAVPPQMGAMSALIMEEGLPAEEIRALAREHEVDVANDNSPKQMVISAAASSVAALTEQLAERFPDMRIVPLAVSAPFHSRHMASIQERFREALHGASSAFVAEHATGVCSNYTGGFHTGKLEDLVDGLTAQIASPVRWQDNMNCLLSTTREGAAIVEVGPGRPLGLFFKALGSTVPAIIDVRSARRVFPNLQGAKS